ncbi:MAG: hypothetical protein WCD42_07225 [Rhizomicrobium sp.]
MHQITNACGPQIRIERENGLTETHVFATGQEAAQRAAIVNAAFDWLGTPFVNCCDKKGPDGGVDCAMLLVRCYCDTGTLPPFDPRPYAPSWFMHQEKELFLEFLIDRLGAQEIAAPRIGDVIVWRYGKTYSHGSILINASEILHAYGVDGSVLISRLEDDPVKYVAVKGLRFLRPVKYFSLWGA